MAAIKVPGVSSVERWLARLKQHPVIAVLVMGSAVLAGVAGVADNYRKLRSLIVPDMPASAPPIVVNVSQPQAPVKRRVDFRKEFRLREFEHAFERGIQVWSPDIGRGIPFLPKVVIESEGQTHERLIGPGFSWTFERSDCESVGVLVKQVLMPPHKDMSQEDIAQFKNSHLGGLSDTREMVIEVFGRCDE